MDEARAPHPRITQALARGWTVLTANQRAARTLRHDFDLHQRARGLTHWQPPAVLAWETWLAGLWHHLLLDGHATEMLLSPTQEHQVWREIIAADAASTSLRPAGSLAQIAADAWQLLHAYRARRRQTYAGNTDTQAFVRWAAEFERRCARSRYLTQAQLPETLCAAFADRTLTPPPGILLVGFDAQTPAQTALLDVLRATSCPIEELTPGSSPGCTLVPTPDDHAELTACALWLRTRLTGQPHARIAVIVPSIDSARTGIDRVFHQLLAPELNDIAAPAGSGPYEFSLGIPLARTPLAATALDLLRWTVGPLALTRVSALLLSPHFAADSFAPDSLSEHLARAEFDAFVLRRAPLLRPEVSLPELLRLATPHTAKLPALLRPLRVLRDAIHKANLTRERTHADWAAIIHDLLEAAGWAARSRDTSIEFQTRRKWESALDELATLDFDGPRVHFAAALAALERIAAETLFAPESRHAPIQIMGPLESAGSTFDAVWFLRANDLDWPATPAPNPLLPWPLQRDLAMPGADTARDTALARRITERIAASAPTVVFSYAQESAEGRRRPSPTLANLALERESHPSALPLACHSDPERAQRVEGEEPPHLHSSPPAPLTLEAFADTPVPSPPGQTLHGGAAILQAQAACAFRAFAEKRLFSSALDPAALGLDPRERGSLVHDVLERFWAEVQTQTALQQMATPERDGLLTQSIDAAIAAHIRNPEPGWPRTYLDAEHQRLLNLLRPWLDYEANERPPFLVKSREETLNDVQIGLLRLNIRVDRVDTALADGEPDSNFGDIILDYKTGAAKPADWLGDRPDAPQLPLYAVVSEPTPLAAVAFASVRAGEKFMGLNGYEAHDGVLPKCTKLKTSSLQAQVEEWRKILTALANDFHSGVAGVAPKQYPQTCRSCEQRLLCRLDPTALEADAIEDFANEPDSIEIQEPENA